MMDLDALSADARVTIRRPGSPDPDGRVVVYWMQRAQRPFDNPALDLAIGAGNALGRPVVVFFGLLPHYPGANLRHYHFLLVGLPDLAAGLAQRRVGFVLRRFPDHSLARFAAEVRPCLVIGDENPLRVPEGWRARLARELVVPLWTVDADVIVPGALIPREQFAARTMRPRLLRLLDRFLVPSREPVARVAWRPPRGLKSLPLSSLVTGGSPPDLAADFVADLAIDRRVGAVAMVGGSSAGRAALQRFVAGGLAGYSTERNHPERLGTSQLSPYLHFGHLGPRGVALAVQAADAPEADRAALLEQLIVRRELAVNFVRANPHYDSLAGCEPWAKAALRRHQGDPRPVRYDEAALEAAATHDRLWNAAQRELIASGWMHGYVRMYWAKKILEWSESPEVAFDVALRLNDRYQLDGRDPNGITGVAWAIGGKHDRAWGPERPIYGTVRYMSFASTSRKFNLDAYVRRVDELG